MTSGMPVTVKGWLRRLAGRAGQVRAWFTLVVVGVAADRSYQSRRSLMRSRR
jgi:hypothetical protein